MPDAHEAPGAEVRGRPNAPHPFPDVPAFNEAFRSMVEDINGFVYAGERLESYIAVVKWLRSNPDRAAFLLGDFDG